MVKNYDETRPTRKQLNCIWKLCKLYGNYNTDWYKLAYESKTIDKKVSISLIDTFKKWENENDLIVKTDLENMIGVFIPDFKIINEPDKSNIVNAPAVEPEPETVTTKEPVPQSDSLSKLIAQAIQEHLKLEPVNQPIDLEQISEHVNSILDERLKEKVIKLKIVKPSGTSSTVTAHHMFEKLLMLAENREHFWLTGPSGSGKSYVAHQIANELGLDFSFLAVGLQTTKSDLLGYMDANGNYIETELYKRYKNGGIFLLDEVDAGNPNVLTVLNNMLSNGSASFPCGMVERHKDFICIACANTYGRGADRVYVGRNPIDGASRDRFFFVDFDYDEKLELELSLNKNWCKRVQAIRKAVFDLKEKIIVSPRASYQGSKYINNGSGFDQTELEDMLIWKGINPEIKNRVLARVQ